MYYFEITKSSCNSKSRVLEFCEHPAAFTPLNHAFHFSAKRNQSLQAQRGNLLKNTEKAQNSYKHCKENQVVPLGNENFKNYNSSFSALKFLSLIVFTIAIGLVDSANAAPGDILFQDDFESGLSQWTVSSSGGDAGISSATANSGTNSLYTRWDSVSVSSVPIDTSLAAQIEVTMWVRRGDDSFSEDPDGQENLSIEFLDSSNNWQSLTIYTGDGTSGEIFPLSIRPGPESLHSNLQLRISQTSGNGSDWDYWHIDDVTVTEVALSTFSCDDFESGFSNWSITNNGGNAGISSATFNSTGNSMYTRWGDVTVTSNPVDTTTYSEVEVLAWVQRGDDSFSEDPDNNEDLEISYLDNSNNWVLLEVFDGNGSGGEIFDRSYLLPTSALHSGFRLRIQQTAGNGSDWDYWHIDDVCVQDPNPPIAGLIGEWQFDELFWNGTNDEVADSSGNNLHLTAVTSITDDTDSAIAGNPGTCGYGVFNGSASFIQLDDDTSTSDSLLDIPDNLTVTTWINTNVIPTSGLKSIISKDENYEFHIDSSGQIYWWWNWSTLTTTGTPLSLNQWYHIAITFRDGEQVIYIDGVERARSAESGTLILNDDPLQVGQDLDIASRFFDGEIDEVRIYENFLDASEINRVMNETRPCTVTGICTETFSDNFSAASYNNSSGTNAWSTDWIELDDDGSAVSGNITITGGLLQMDDLPNSGGEPSLERELDLSSFDSAFLTLDLATSGNLENGDRFDVSASTDGGISYDILQSFSSDVTGNFSFDLASYLTSNARIRLRIENGYGNSGEFINVDNLVITGQKPCGPDHFRILHDGSAINCLREAVTIRAENADNSIMNDYVGTVNISLSTNNGNWFIADETGTSADPAQGNLVDTAGDNDGSATYDFVIADSGSVVLYLQNTIAESANINVNEGAILDENTEGDITFRPFGFTFSPSPISTQVAGKPFDLVLTAAGQTPSNPECGVIEEYTGVKSINFWSTYTSPITSSTQVMVNANNIATSEATSAAQNVTFTNGVTTISSQYDDVGQISISAKDEIDLGDPPSGNLDEIIGGISPFVVRPFGFDIQIASSPFADDGNDSVFRSAGANFDMTLRSVLWETNDDLNNDGVPDPFIDTDADGIPDTGGDLSDNGATTNISSIAGAIALSPAALVVSNSNGTLSDIDINFSEFSATTAEVTISQSWSEVGILQIDALNTDFMGGGENVTGERINIGRFIPDHFNLSAPVIVDQCGSFTYGGFFDGVNAGLDKNGQTFDVSGTITAQNASNNTTQNYAGVFAKLTSGDINVQPHNADTSIDDTGRVNFSSAALNFVGGISNYVDTTTDYQFDSLRAPFNLQLDMTATDSDSVTSGIVSSNTIEPRNGRVRIPDSYGPELAALEARIFADYFDGSNWVQNTADSCTTYIDTLVSFDVASYTDQLDNGETSITAPNSSQTLSSGVSSLANGFWFSAPGDGNFGSVDFQMDLSTQSWMQFDWDEDNSLENANARLSFGYYRGSDRVIYWKEIR